MTRFATRSALAAILGLVLAGTGRAETKPHKESTDGTINVSELVSPTVAVQEWTAEGRATQFGRYTEAGGHKADLATGAIYDGEFESTAADGSTASGIYFGSFTINADGTVDYEVTAIYLSGTGRFQGLDGVASVAAHATGAAPGSTFHFDADGHLDLP